MIINNVVWFNKQIWPTFGNKDPIVDDWLWVLTGHIVTHTMEGNMTMEVIRQHALWQCMGLSMWTIYSCTVQLHLGLYELKGLPMGISYPSQPFQRAPRSRNLQEGKDKDQDWKEDIKYSFCWPMRLIVAFWSHNCCHFFSTRHLIGTGKTSSSTG